MKIGPEGAELLMRTRQANNLLFTILQTRLKIFPSRYTIRWWPPVKWGYRCFAQTTRC